MFTLPGVSRPPATLLFLLGLLALLLWGQCGGGVLSVRPMLKAGIASTDSLAGRPTTLFLTVTVSNTSHQPFLLRGASGTLQFGHQHWPFADSMQLNGQLVPAQSARRFRLGIPLVAPPETANSLAALRAALAVGSRDTNSLRLAWQLSYAGQRTPQAHLVAYYYTTLPALNSVR